jgi:hypothetical protein
VPEAFEPFGEFVRGYPCFTSHPFCLEEVVFRGNIESKDAEFLFGLGSSIDDDGGDEPAEEDEHAGNAKGFREFHGGRRLEQSSAFGQGITESLCGKWSEIWGWMAVMRRVLEGSGDGDQRGFTEGAPSDIHSYG